MLYIELFFNYIYCYVFLSINACIGSAMISFYIFLYTKINQIISANIIKEILVQDHFYMKYSVSHISKIIIIITSNDEL